MKKSLVSCSLVLAGLLGGMSAVQAQLTTDAPRGEASTVTGGAPNMRTTNSPYPDGTVLVPVYPAVVATQAAPMHGVGQPVVVHSHAMPMAQVHVRPHAYDHTRASLTSDVPTRAGEASTYTNGAPNLVTSNTARAPHHVYVVPHPYGMTVVQ